MTPAQCRAARALIGWSRKRLADASGVHERTIYDFERGTRKPHAATLSVLVKGFEEADVILIGADQGGGEGVRK